MTGQLALNLHLQDSATFANYVGEAAGRLLNVEGCCYLWGNPESGRSHLLQALCHQARERGRSAIYLEQPGTHDAAVLDGLETVSVVCIDDIEQILGQRDWEISLFNLINAVRNARGCLVVSALSPSKQLSVELKDLHSRLTAAVAVQTDRLTDLQKLEVLTRRAQSRGFALNDDVGRFMLQRVPRGMRTLVTLLDRIETETLVRQKKVTIPLVKAALGI